MDGVAGEAYVLQPGEGRAIDLGTFSMSVKASADETDGTFTLLEAGEPPDFGPPLHVHHGIAEAFYVLEGSTSSSWMRRSSAARPGRSSSSRPKLPTGSG